MKKLSILLVAAMVSFLSFTNVFANTSPVAVTPTNVGVDSVRVAQAMGGVDLSVLQGQYSFDRGASYGGYVSFRFKMQGGKIVYLAEEQANGLVVLVGENDAPLSGIPTNAVGETRNFSLYLSTPKGDAFGSFNKDLLLPGEGFEIVLGPGRIERIVPFSGIGKTKPENAVLKTDDGNVSEYNQQAGGFSVWVDPLRSTPYTIVDTMTGLPVAVGTINPVEQKPVNTISVVSVGFKGGVVPISDSRAYLANQKFDGQLADGTFAKVYLWALNGAGGNVNVWSRSQTGTLKVRILRWIPMEQGEMLEVANSDNKQQATGYAYSYVGNGYDKVIIVITSEGVDTFDVDFSAAK